MSPTEAERFTQDLSSTGDAKYATSNSWLEVNSTQLVLNAKDVLTQVKPGAIPLAMVKVCSLLLSALRSVFVLCQICSGYSAADVSNLLPGVRWLLHRPSAKTPMPDSACCRRCGMKVLAWACRAMDMG